MKDSQRSIDRLDATECTESTEIVDRSSVLSVISVAGSPLERDVGAVTFA